MYKRKSETYIVLCEVISHHLNNTCELSAHCNVAGENIRELTPCGSNWASLQVQVLSLQSREDIIGTKWLAVDGLV